MAEEEEIGQEKTEEPSAERQEKFREEGQIVRSNETTSLAVMAAASISLIIFGDDLSRDFLQGTQELFGSRFFGQASSMDAMTDTALLFMAPVAKTVAFISLSLFAGVLVVSLIQTGLLFSPKSLTPKLEALNPLEGFSKIFRKENIFQMGKNILKVFAIGAIVYFTLQSHLTQITLLPSASFWESIRWSGGLFFSLAVKVGIFLFLVAIIDYVYQWRALHKKMMMSRQELKQEMKENQVSEHVRAKVSQIRKERAKRTIQKAVPKADVIVTNPTHFAVALSYRRNADRAPKVVAKGADLIAALIRKLAAENNVPIYEYPELARGLYRKVRVGHSIPAELYESVARVLSYVYKMHKRRAERRF